MLVNAAAIRKYVTEAVKKRDEGPRKVRISKSFIDYVDLIAVRAIERALLVQAESKTLEEPTLAKGSVPLELKE